MKKIYVLIVSLFLTIPVYSQVTLSSRDSITTIVETDIMLWQTDDTGFKNRQMSWRILRGQISGYLDGIPLTWAAIQDFNGANFTAGSHGGTTFSDSVYHNTGVHYVNWLYPAASAIPGIGTLSSPYRTIYSKQFIVPNEEGNDSVLVSFDDSTLTINRDVSFSSGVNITDDITMDSAAVFNVFNFEPHSYTVPNTGDTILTLTTSDLYSSIKLDLPGDIDPGISKIQVDTASEGMVLRFYNADEDYEMIFLDVVAGDDNLYMSGNFTCQADNFDHIQFECVDATKGAQKWMQTGESDN
ncbi:MAG: hypothetical protein GY804_09770 [Alphaproteobacteria bacterium]|nr:hypothetical protein [Alphaproteobacteria bacterium]